MKRVCCQNCGTQVLPLPSGLGDWPLEEMVSEDDRIRELQMQALRKGMDPRHSINIASNFPVARVQELRVVA